MGVNTTGLSFDKREELDLTLEEFPSCKRNLFYLFPNEQRHENLRCIRMCFLNNLLTYLPRSLTILEFT